MGCGASKHKDPSPAQAKADGRPQRKPTSTPSKQDSPDEIANKPGPIPGVSTVLLLGSDATGKDTVGEALAKDMNCTYLSYQNVLKEEVKEGTPTGIRLAEMIKQGKIIPSFEMAQLFKRAIANTIEKGPHLIDGFPKSLENLTGFEEKVAMVSCAVFLEMSDEKATSELMKRQDVEAERVDRKLRQFKLQSLPVVKALEKRGICHKLYVDDISGPDLVSAVKKILVKKNKGGSGKGAVAAIAASGKPNGPIVFVLGGPGSGKGTQCAKLVEKYGCAHFSAGDLLREEIKTKSPNGAMIQDMIARGQIVPGQVTVDLLKAAIASSAGPYLIDGFPRSMDNLDLFEAQVGPCATTFFFDLTDEVMEERLLKRGETSGRSDDNPETIKRRFRTFETQSMPVVEALQKRKLVKKFDASKNVDDIHKEVCKMMDTLK